MSCLPTYKGKRYNSIEEIKSIIQQNVNVNNKTNQNDYLTWYNQLSEEEKISEETRLLNNSERVNEGDIVFMAKRGKKRKVKIEDIPVTEDEVTLRTQKALLTTIARLTKRAVIIEAKGKDVSLEDKNELKTLENAYSSAKYFQGLMEFSKNTSDSLDEQIDLMLDIIERINSNTDLLPPQGMAKLLRDAHRYFSAIKPIIESIRDEFGDEFTAEIQKELDKAKINANASDMMKELENNLSILKGKVDKLSTLYYRAATPIFADFLSTFVGKSGLLPNEIEELLKSTDKDINFWQRWLFSMAETSDTTLRLFNEAVGRAKEKSRLATIDLKRDLLNMRDELIKNNIFDYDWMLDKTDGKINGYFIDKYKWDAFIKARVNFYMDLKRRYNIQDNDVPISKQLTKEQLKKYNKEQADWYKENTKFNKANLSIYLENKKRELGVDAYNEWINDPKHVKRNLEGDIINIVDTIIPDTDIAVVLPADKWLNKEYNKLNDVQLRFLNNIINIKKELDSYLPMAHRSKLLAPQIRKDVIERAKQLKTLSGAKKLAKEIIEDYNVADELDRGYDNKQNILTDVEGKPVDLLPVKFTKKLKDPHINMSVDVVGSMVIYGGMANDFKEMNSILDILETGKDVLRQRKLSVEASPGNIAIETIKVFGKKLENKVTTKSDATNAYNRLEDYFQMVVYGKYKKTTNKTIFGKDQEKMLDLLGKYTAINGLALNLFAGIANVGFGEIMLGIEARAGEFINDKSLAKGTAKYFANLPKTIGNIGKIKADDKLSLWLEYFNTLQEFESELHEVDTQRKSRFSKLFRTSSLFFINNIGEHWMQTRLSLALAEETKVLDASGAQISLFDAFTIENGKLVLKEGIKRLDGSEWTQDDTIAFIRKQNFINKRMHGIYNYVDRAAMQQYALGRLALMFRKFLVPSVNRRFLGKQYNFEGDVETEGYYLTGIRFLGLLMKELKQGQFSLMKHYNSLSNVEKYNIKRFGTEVLMLIALSLLAAFVFDDDEQSDSWGYNLMAYEVNRMITELGAYNPITAPRELFTLLKTPAPSINTIQDIYNFSISLIFDFNDEITKGKFEGWYRWQKSGFNLIPGVHQAYDILTPEEKLKYFTFTK